MLSRRRCAYPLLALTMAVLTLPNLGTHSLWDVDEGVNAEASREMAEAGAWVTPTFNFELRTAKPVMIYWVQRASYALFGVSEWSARLPSVLLSLGTILLTYELARRMFGKTSGLLAGLVLGSAIEFCMLAHAATPDATLLFFTTLALTLYRLFSENGSRAWMVPTAIAGGLAVLTKGPVGIALPGLVIALHLFWNGELSRVWNRRLGWAIGAFLLTALPWYILVTVETRGEFARQFFGKENLGRFMTPMENHRGPIFYHAALILVLFAPWSVFIGPTLYSAIRGARREKDRDLRFLLVWVGAYLVFFSIAATKLPNYVLPLYPALAILTSRYLVLWLEERIVVRRWLMPVSVGLFLAVGVGMGVGLGVAGGSIPLPFGKMRLFPGLEQWMALGLVPIVGGIVAILFWRVGRKDRMIGALTTAAILFTAGIAAWPVLAIDAKKAPRALVAEAELVRPSEDIRLGAWDWFQPSVVFYAQREVKKFTGEAELLEFWSRRQPAYVFISEPAWNDVSSRIPEGVTLRTIARQYDFLKNQHILVVTNR